MQLLFADHVLDTGRRELRRGSGPVPVEPQVLDLLIYLVQNRDRVVSKGDLIAAIWGGRIVSDETMTSRIHAARKAVGDSGREQKLIRTIARKGFRFVGDVRAQSGGDGPQPLAADPPARAAGAPADDPRAGSRHAAPMPDRPAIAVLPFTNMSGDPEQEYFSDGISEDIITALSRLPWFFVIARNSSFAYKGKPVSIKQVAEELGVRYVLEGSVRKGGDRVRVTGQLIDAASGIHLWAEKYDRKLADIFVLQDDVASRVIGSVAPHILAAEAVRAQRKPPQSIDAWDLVMQAVPHMWRMSTPEHRRAQELLGRAIALDADYAHAHALLGWTYLNRFNLDTRTPIRAFTDQALAAGTQAIMLDQAEHWGHLVVGLGRARRRDPELALWHLAKSLELNPNFALGHAGRGYALACSGRPEQGLQALEQAHKLSPRDPFLAIYSPIVRYMALFALERYEDTIAVCRSTAALHPDHAGAWRLMTAALGLLGRIDDAKAALAHTLTLQPDFSSAHVEVDTVYADPADRSRFLEGLRKAGLKD